MKRKIISLLIAGIAIMTIGFFYKKTKIVDIEKTNFEFTHSSEELFLDVLYDRYKRILPKVESIFTELNIDYTTNILNYEGNNKGDYGMEYENEEETTPGTIIRAKYNATFGLQTIPDEINGSISQSLDRKNIINNGFKFEESPLYKLSKIFIEEAIGKKDIDYSSVDIIISEAVKNNTEVSIENSYGVVKERIAIYGDEIYCELSIR